MALKRPPIENRAPACCTSRNCAPCVPTTCGSPRLRARHRRDPLHVEGPAGRAVRIPANARGGAAELGPPPLGKGDNPAPGGDHRPLRALARLRPARRVARSGTTLRRSVPGTPRPLRPSLPTRRSRRRARSKVAAGRFVVPAVREHDLPPRRTLTPAKGRRARLLELGDASSSRRRGRAVRPAWRPWRSDGAARRPGSP